MKEKTLTENSNPNWYVLSSSIPSIVIRNVPSVRSSPHHGAIVNNSPRDDGFRSGLILSTHTSESPTQWTPYRKGNASAMI